MVAFFGGIVKILETASGLNFEQIMNRTFSLFPNFGLIFRLLIGILPFLNIALAGIRIRFSACL